MTAPAHTTIGIRLDDKLRDKLQAQADGEHRRLSNLIVKILWEYSETIDKPSAKGKLNGHAHKAAAPVT